MSTAIPTATPPEQPSASTEPGLSRLSRGIREYSLFQGVQLVLGRLQAAHPERDEEALYQHLELQANPSMGFPGSDIDRVQFFEEHGELRARLRINLVSLFGAGSPLPAFYGEQAPGGSEGGAAAPFRAALSPVAARGGAQPRPPSELNWKRLLPYLGLLSLRAHSAALIESVLRYYFKHAALHIEQCLERQVEILGEQRNRLGLANSQLGESLVLGEFVRDRGGKFRIHVRQLNWDRFHEFLPIGSGYQPLCALVRFTLRDPLDYDIRLELRQDEIRELRLGADNPCLLGWTTWLGRDNADGVVTLGSKTH